MKKILFIAAALLFAVSCSAPDKRAELDNLKKEHDQIAARIAQLEKELNPGDTVEVTTVAVKPVAREVFEHYIEVQGRVDGNENVGVSPRTPGVVTKIYVREGDVVRKGQVLADLDAEVLKQTLKEAEDQLVYVTDVYERQKSLWDQKIGSEIQYLTSKNTMESVQNRVNTIKDQIKMSTITSPIDGTIEDIPIKVGQMAGAGIPAFRVINFSRPKAVADVGEAYSGKINTGDRVKVYFPDVQLEQERVVTFASKFINPTNRTFVVEVELKPGEVVYRANMIAVIRINDYRKENTISVPQNYIQASPDGEHFIFVANEEKGIRTAKKVIITTGNSYNGLTEITGGLEEGNLIITAGYKDLYDGQRIDYK